MPPVYRLEEGWLSRTAAPSDRTTIYSATSLNPGHETAVNLIATTGYGKIAQMLGLSKARVQQIAREPDRPVLAAYAACDEVGGWQGEPDLLPPGRYREAASFIQLTPADENLP